MKLATTRPLLVAVIDQLHLSDTPDQLARRITAASAVNTTLLTITAADPSPANAAAIANALAAELIKASPDLQGQEADIHAFVTQDLKATQAQIETTQAQVNQLEAQPTRTAEEEAQLNLLQNRLTTLRSSYVAALVRLERCVEPRQRGRTRGRSGRSRLAETAPQHAPGRHPEPAVVTLIMVIATYSTTASRTRTTSRRSWGCRR